MNKGRPRRVKNEIRCASAGKLWRRARTSVLILLCTRGGRGELGSLRALSSVSPENEVAKSCAESETTGYKWEPGQDGGKSMQRKWPGIREGVGRVAGHTEDTDKGRKAMRGFENPCIQGGPVQNLEGWWTAVRPQRTQRGRREEMRED